MKVILDDGSEIIVNSSEARVRISTYLRRLLRANTVKRSAVPWSENELAELRILAQGGVKYKDVAKIAASLHRTAGGVKTKLSEMGLIKKLRDVKREQAESQPVKQFTV